MCVKKKSVSLSLPSDLFDIYPQTTQSTGEKIFRIKRNRILRPWITFESKIPNQR